MNSDKVLIDKTELNKLYKAEAKLNALENGGVNNWEWYSESLENYWKEWEPEVVEEDDE